MFFLILVILFPRNSSSRSILRLGEIKRASFYKGPREELELHVISSESTQSEFMVALTWFSELGQDETCPDQKKTR